MSKAIALDYFSILKELIHLKDKYIMQLQLENYELEQLHTITFEVIMKPQRNAESEDLLTIVFSDKAAEAIGFPDFADSVISEFSFCIFITSTYTKP